MKQCQCKNSHPTNGFVNKGLKVIFYFKKKTIPKESVSDNKQKSMSVIELYKIIFVKINNLS